MPAKLFIRKLASYLVETPIPDLNSGMRAFRRDVALQYVSQLPAGFSCVTTITMTFLAHGYSVKYWPIDYSERAGSSKFHWWSDTRRYLLQVIRMMLSFNPLRVFLPHRRPPPRSSAWSSWCGTSRQRLPASPSTPLLIFFAAFQVFVVGMLADLDRAGPPGPATRSSRPSPRPHCTSPPGGAPPTTRPPRSPTPSATDRRPPTRPTTAPSPTSSLSRARLEVSDKVRLGTAVR